MHARAQVNEAVREKYPHLCMTLDAMAVEVSRSFNSRQEERLLAVVHALLHRYMAWCRYAAWEQGAGRLWASGPPQPSGLIGSAPKSSACVPLSESAVARGSIFLR